MFQTSESLLKLPIADTGNLPLRSPCKFAGWTCRNSNRKKCLKVGTYLIFNKMKNLILAVSGLLLVSCNPYGKPFNCLADSGGNTIIGGGGKKSDFTVTLLSNSKSLIGDPILTGNPKKKDVSAQTESGGSGILTNGKKLDCFAATYSGGNGTVLGGSLKRDLAINHYELSNLIFQNHG